MNDPIFGHALHWCDVIFGGEIDSRESLIAPALIGSNCSKPSRAPHDENDAAGNSAAPGLQERPDCVHCHDTGRRIHNGCYTLERCWCVAGDAFAAQRSLI